MRTRFAVVLGALLAAVLISGCGKSGDNRPAPNASSNPAGSQSKNSGGGYFDLLAEGHHEAKEMAQNAPAQQCVAAFHALNDRYPKDLEELNKANLAPPPPPKGMKYDYNPKTGDIKVVPEK